MKVDLEKFYSIILKARIHSGYSQTNMSYFLGISQKNYFYLESGRCKMDLIKFLKIVDALEINPMEVISSIALDTKWPDTSTNDFYTNERQKHIEEIQTLTSRNQTLQEIINKMTDRENK